MKKEFSELDILTILYFYSKNFHAYMLRLDPEFFSDDHETFFKIVRKYYKAYNKVPSRHAILLECENDEKESLGSFYDNMFQHRENIKHLAHDFIVEKLDAFAKKNYLKKFLIESYDEYEQGKYEEIIDKFGKLRECVIDNDMGVEYHDESFLDSRYSNDEMNSSIPTGFEQFDKSFSGWHKKSLNIVAGPANSGKTMWLINIVKNRLLQENDTGNRILYVTLEIDKEQVGRRLDCAITGTSSKDIWQKENLSMMREILASSKDGLNNRVMIKELPGYKTTPADIEACMRNLEVVSDGDLKPTMVIIDYLGLLTPNHYNPKMGLYEKGLELAVELRSLAQQYNIPFIVAAQTNRNSFQDRPGMDSIADSIGISQTADLMITINRKPDLDQNNQVEGYLAKSRFCKAGMKFIFAADYETMQLTDVVGGDILDTEEEEM